MLKNRLLHAVALRRRGASRKCFGAGPKPPGAISSRLTQNFGPFETMLQAPEIGLQILLRVTPEEFCDHRACCACRRIVLKFDDNFGSSVASILEPHGPRAIDCRTFD